MEQFNVNEVIGYLDAAVHELEAAAEVVGTHVGEWTAEEQAAAREATGDLFDALSDLGFVIERSGACLRVAKPS